MDYKLPKDSTNLVFIMLFPNTFIVKEVIPAVIIHHYEERLNFF